ncbi:MAG: YbjQ family protein [Magnetospirillum sp.]|nr:YbjQ family protein [Magnetospirillum sp.]
MIVTTTESVEGARIASYLGIVSGDAVLGTNVFKDLFASIRDVVGGRAASYEKVLQDGKDMAIADMIARAKELGADAVVGVDLDYEVIGGDSKTLLMVSVNGTAVTLGG